MFVPLLTAVACSANENLPRRSLPNRPLRTPIGVASTIYRFKIIIIKTILIEIEVVVKLKTVIISQLVALFSVKCVISEWNKNGIEQKMKFERTFSHPFDHLVRYPHTNVKSTKFRPK